MTTHAMDPPSDIDVDLSSDAGSDNPIDETEAAQLLQSAKLYGFGSASAQPNQRRMDFSPSPSPPPPPGQPLPPLHAHEPMLPPSGSADVPPAAAGEPLNGHGSDAEGDGASAKEGSVESSSLRHGSPSAADTTATPSRARTSIWAHFTRDPDYATNRRGRCVYCHNYYSCSSGSTGNMWRHIKRTHPDKAAIAAPLGTHAAHDAALPPTPTPAKPFAAAGASGSETRSRKRHASFSLPGAEHSTRAAPHMQQRGASRAQDDAAAAAFAQQHSYPEVPARALRAHEDSVMSPDAAGSSAENLAQALRMLISSSGRPYPTVDRAGTTSQSVILQNLLDSLNLASTSRGSVHPSASADSAYFEPSAATRLPRASFRPPGTAPSAAANSAGGSNLPTIAESSSSMSHEQYAAQGAATGTPGSRLFQGYGVSPDMVDSDSVGRFVAAVADAIRANTESSLAGSRHGGQAQRTLNAYIDFMVRDLVPVDRMLAPAMQQLMSSMSRDGAAAVPSAKALADELLRLKDARLHTLHRQLAAVGGRISVSIGTGCLAASLHYLAVYAHWVDADFVRHDELLDWHCLDGSPASADIISIFEGTLTRFGLFDRLGAVATTYTREFVEFLNQVETICHARGVSFDLDRNQATCIVSTLLGAREKLVGSLRVPASAEATAGQSPMRIDSTSADFDPTLPLKKLSVAVRDLCRPDAPGSQQLVGLCRSRGIELSAFDFDNSKTWGSAVALLDAALPIYMDLSDILLQHDEAAQTAISLSSVEWLALSQTRLLMRLLNVATDALARLPAEFPSIVEVVPIYDALVDNVLGFLQTPSLCREAVRLGEALRDYLAQSHPFQASPVYRLAPVFDPRLKTTYYADRGYDQAWTARVVREAQSILAEFATPAATAYPPQHAAGTDLHSISQSVAAAAQQGDVKAQIDSFVRLGDPKTASQVASDNRARTFRRAQASARSELDDYLAAPLAAPSAPPASWWKMHHAAFPDLARLAREYLSIPSSSNSISLLLKRTSLPDFSQLAGLDKKLIAAYACLHHWQPKEEDRH